jgi:hypothetical protein
MKMTLPTNKAVRSKWVYLLTIPTYAHPSEFGGVHFIISEQVVNFHKKESEKKRNGARKMR